MTRRELAARTIMVLALVAVAWFLAGVVRETTDILVLLLISAILAAGLAPHVAALERCRLPLGLRCPRGLAILVLYLGLFAVVAVILSMIIIPAVNEARSFIAVLPDDLRALETWLRDQQRASPLLPDLATMVQRLPLQISHLAEYGATAAGVAFRFIGGLAATISVLVFTFYMLVDGPGIKRAFLRLFPAPERPRVDRVLGRISEKFGGWFRGQILLSFTIAVVVAVALLLIGVPYPFLLGLIAGIGEFIPLVGLWLGATVGILVALSQPAWRLVATVIFYVVIMNLEPHVLVPRIMARAVGLSPLLTLSALLVGIKLMGIMGGLLAVPVAAALQVIASEIAQEIQPDT